MSEFQELADWYDREEESRMRRERRYETLRGDVPLESGAIPGGHIPPHSMSQPTFRQICRGEFDDYLNTCLFMMHDLTERAHLREIVMNLKLDHKEILFFLGIRLYTTQKLAELRGQTERNIRKVRDTVQRRIHRKAKIINNIFYDCGEAAIVFPTEDNTAEGNLYVKMQGGYLRVMYPAPETCLNLPAWQEFYGFDQTGQYAWFDMELNEADGKLSLKKSEYAPFALPRQLKLLHVLMDPAGISAVPADPHVPADRDGTPHRSTVLPGPLALYEIQT